MNNYQKILLQLSPKQPLPKKIKTISLPTLYHCIGNDKLIGQYYGEAIFEDIMLNNEKEMKRKLSILGVMLRAYIVIDDFMKDHKLLKHNKYLTEWLDNIKDYLVDILNELCVMPNDLWSKYNNEYNAAYYNFNASNIFLSIIKKCYLIYIPFSLNIVKSKARSEKTFLFMKKYLFALQLLDDFQDMEEDINSPKNHNIFLSNIKTQYIETIIANKALLVPSLLFYIKRNLIEMLQDVRSNIIATFIHHNLKWIDSQLLNTSYGVQIIHIDSPFITFDFNNILPEFMDNILKNDNTPKKKFFNIRAENLHTVKNINT